MMDTKAIGRAGKWIVGVKVAILLLFVGVGFAGIKTTRGPPGSWSPPLQLVAGGMIIFVAYEGFELIANTAKDVRNVATTLPRAFYAAVGFVIALYVLVSLVTVGQLTVDKIVAAKDYALTEAARPLLGQTGFTIIAIAAMVSTASAINATFYSTSRLSYSIARADELPDMLERNVWGQPVWGLLISAGLTLIVANAFDLTSIATLGSAGFLLIFAAVNVANAHDAARTHSRGWISSLGAAACLAALAALVWQMAQTAPMKLWTLAVMLGLAALIESGNRLAKRQSNSLADRPTRERHST